MTLSNVQDDFQHKAEDLYPASQPIKINHKPTATSVSNIETGSLQIPSEMAFNRESNLYDEDSVSQYSIDDYHGDINEDTINGKSNRKQKRSFFERIGLRKKSASSLPQYKTTLSGDLLVEQPQLSDDEDHHHREEEEEEEEDSSSDISSAEENDDDDEEGPVPQISVSSPSVDSNGTNKANYDSGINGKYIKMKTKHKKYNQEFSRLILAQTIHTTDADMEPTNPNHPYGALWTIRFSKDGQYLASAGQSCVIHLWKLLLPQDKESINVLDETPYREYKGHTADVLDLAWSKNNFLLSSSMDNTVRLWHTSQKECLCVFQHLNFVTSIEFHPKDDRFFLSGSMDGRIRIWNIPEKRVAFWNEIPDNKLATAIGFTLDGKTVIAGSHDGHCYFFDTQSLKYNTQISVIHDNTTNNRNSSSKKGPKITGIEVFPGLPPGDEKVLITSNDSRVRLYNMKDKSLMFKYKGSDNTALQIKATFSDDGRYIISGSEDCHTYIWRTEQSSAAPYLHENRNKAISALGQAGELSSFSFDSGQSSPQQTRISKWLKRDDHHKKIKSRTEYFEAHDHVVTATVFAPTKTRQHIARSKQDIIYNHTPLRRMSTATSSSGASSSGSLSLEEVYPDGHIIITADYRGVLKVWRIDSGNYTPTAAPFDTQSMLHASESSLNTISSTSTKSSIPSPKARFGGLFSSKHPK